MPTKDVSYIDTGNYRIRCVHEPDLPTTPLPANVTEITVRRGARVVMLHGKRPPSEYLKKAAEEFGTPGRD